MSTYAAVYTCTECKLRSLRLRPGALRSVERRLFHAARTLQKHVSEVDSKDDVIKNPANVQLLSPRLQEQVLGAYSKRSKVSRAKDREKLAIQHLKKQEIWGKTSDIQPPINLRLPSLYGKDIEDHFVRIGIEQSGGYLTQAETFAKVQLPPMPKKWSQQSGWTRYDKESVSKVPHPLEDTVAFDVEVLVGTSQYPVMAVAASADAWYSWTSPFITGESNSPEHLIPLGKTESGERLVVGHNVGYDRARIADEYSRVLSGLRFLDTMSLHIAVSGLCSQQRPQWIKRRNQEEAAIESASGTSEDEIGEVKFFDVSSLNSLKDVVKFHCKTEMDKSTRSYFETGTLEDVRENFQEAMQYCAQDVAMTHAVYKTVFPKFRANCPHPVSFAGMLLMGNSFLTVTEKWEEYLKRSSGKHEELSGMLDVKLRDLAEKARELVTQPDVWQSDPWLSQLDWTVNPRQRKLKGQPKWYKDAYDSKKEMLKVSIRSRIAPLLLRLKWNGYPLHYMAPYAWCYKVPLDQLEESLEPKVVQKDEKYAYIKVPHKDGEQANCGNPLAKNYISSFEDKVLTSEFEAARQALELNAQSAYWISSRERILGQFVVWDNNPTVDMKLPERRSKPHSKYGIILPQMVTMGTITRRAVEKTWLTASNAKANRIGSELKSMVQAPEGYTIVGADVDSEELWISSVIGDAQFGFHGATALGWMTLQGSKSEGTDLHSRTASILGISRDKAKIFNYARIYGAGVKYATSLLLQYSQDMDSETAKTRAVELYASTKGEKEHSAKNPFSRTFWHGGSESYMFNALEDIALSKEPRTPVLGCAITDALKPQYAGSQFLTSRINWVVQSSGVDYLHLLIVAMAHLIERYNINARFMLSVHDEVRYLASEEDQHRTALALQVANLWTRALFSWRLGIKNLPQSVAFFSAVDIDHVLRKEPTMTCTTPSHQEKIAEGVSCTLEDTLQALETATQQKREETCLLGQEKETAGKGLDDKIIRKLLQDTQSSLKTYDLDFLKAQMHRDYRKRLEPSLRGSAQTEEKMSSKKKAAPVKREVSGKKKAQETIKVEEVYPTTETPSILSSSPTLSRSISSPLSPLSRSPSKPSEGYYVDDKSALLSTTVRKKRASNLIQKNVFWS